MLKLEKRIGTLIFFIICFLVPSFLSAKELTFFQEQARLYRDQGLEFQKQGRLEAAMVYYQKAISLDPDYVVAFNDLGIVYEVKRWLDKAEKIYLTALRIDPTYLPVYSNLAMFYEQKKDFHKAISFWKKRIELGRSDELVVKKAKERLRALAEFYPPLREELIQQEVKELNQEIENRKRVKRLKELVEAKKFAEEAKKLFQHKEYEKALNNIALALANSPEDEELLDVLLKLKQEVTNKLREEEKKARIAQMQIIFQNAMRHYQQDNLQEAERELDKITTEVSSSLKNN